jgi:NADH-quinone oxidoreductase subunit N
MFYFVVLSLLGIFSIILGIFLALYETNIKRLLGYSSIVHMGFIILILSVGTYKAIVSCFVYLIIYLFLVFCAFISLAFLKSSNILYDLQNITTLQMFRECVLSSMLFGLTMFSIGGIPPILGFLTKYLLVNVLVESYNYFFAFFSVI